MRWDWLWASLVGAGLLLICAPSHARVPTRLVYARTQSARDCPDEAALAAAVAARLGYEPFSPWGDQTILATITRNGGVLLGRAELIDHDGLAQGSREVRLAKSECDELILALALAISITLDPLHVEAPLRPPADVPSRPADPPESGEPLTPEPATAPTPAVAAVAVEDRRPVLSRGPRWQPQPVTWHVAGAAIGALNVGPQFAMGGRLGVTARRGRWALGIEGWSTFPSTLASQTGEVGVRLLSAALTPCLRLVGGFSLCALGSLGAMRAEGRGVEAPRVENVLHVAVGSRGLFVWPLGSAFELLANADLAATLHRPRFHLDDAEVWRPGPALAMVGIGAAARFF
jgi:hypothetical protein